MRPHGNLIGISGRDQLNAKVGAETVRDILSVRLSPPRRGFIQQNDRIAVGVRTLYFKIEIRTSDPFDVDEWGKRRMGKF
jgi:hypothetical protein